MKFTVTVLTTIALGIGFSARADDKDAKSLLGTWNATLWQTSDTTLINPADIPLSVVITKDTLTMDDGKNAKASKYKLDLTKNPIEIDMTPEEGKKKGQTFKGICEVQDGTFRLCMNPRDGERPSKFEVKKDQNFVLIEFKRAGK